MKTDTSSDRSASSGTVPAQPSKVRRVRKGGRSIEAGYLDGEFEFDFALACNMMLGQNYEQARESAREWVAEARE